METAEIVELCKRHTLFNWAPRDAVAPLPIGGAEGVWLHGLDGERILDFNSQLMSVNIGHGHPKVIAAMKAQLDELVYAFPHSATRVRAELGWSPRLGDPEAIVQSARRWHHAHPRGYRS